MAVTKYELEQLKADIVTMQQSSGTTTADALDVLKVIELRRISSNLEYLGSIMENAPWNIKNE